jgi:hypothetical protein
MKVLDESLTFVSSNGSPDSPFTCVSSTCVTANPSVSRVTSVSRAHHLTSEPHPEIPLPEQPIANSAPFLVRSKWFNQIVVKKSQADPFLGGIGGNEICDEQHSFKIGCEGDYETEAEDSRNLTSDQS